MTLAEVVKKFDENETLYMGCEDGSSYWFIGTPKAFLDNIKLVNDRFIKKYKYKQRVAEDRLKNSKQKKSQRLRDERNSKMYADKVTNWVNLEDRKVVEVYEKISDGVAIIVEGSDMGTYWLKGECRYGIKKD